MRAMKPLATLLLATCALRAFADDAAVEHALLDLKSKDAATRDAAEKTLEAQDGEEALPMCRGALAVTDDADMKARLERVCRSLAGDDRVANLATVWMDRWFLLREGGHIRATEHDTAVRKDVDGKPAWIFHQEMTSRREGKDAVDTWKLDLTCSGDEWLSLHEASMTLDSGSEGSAWMKITLKGEQVHYEGKSAGKDGKDSKDLGHDVAMPGGKQVALDAVLANLVELMSLRRRKRADIPTAYSAMYPLGKIYTYRVEYRGTENVTIGGEARPCRHYARVSPDGREDHYWVDDEKGLVKGHMQGYDSDTRGYDLELCDEQVAKKAMGR
jgi:hypothetical protein